MVLVEFHARFQVAIVAGRSGRAVLSIRPMGPLVEAEAVGAL
jgi:hypothetical protein